MMGSTETHTNWPRRSGGNLGRRDQSGRSASISTVKRLLRKLAAVAFALVSASERFHPYRTNRRRSLVYATASEGRNYRDHRVVASGAAHRLPREAAEGACSSRLRSHGPRRHIPLDAIPHVVMLQVRVERHPPCYAGRARIRQSRSRPSSVRIGPGRPGPEG
jgi:hypothetical protein